jgi:hypothetical protein
VAAEASVNGAIVQKSAFAALGFWRKIEPYGWFLALLVFGYVACVRWAGVLK